MTAHPQDQNTVSREPEADIMTDTQPGDREIEAALRAFYKHTAVQNFPQASRDQMERALEAARPFLPSPDVSGEVLGALRGLAIVLGVRLTYGGGEIPNGWHCKLCKSEWDYSGEEKHSVDCLLTRAQSPAAHPDDHTQPREPSLSPVHGAVPGGWVLMPKEPTLKIIDEMIVGYTAFVGDSKGDMFARMYRCALSAALSPPAQGRGQPPRDVSEEGPRALQLGTLSAGNYGGKIYVRVGTENAWHWRPVTSAERALMLAALASAPPAQGEPGERQPIETAGNWLVEQFSCEGIWSNLQAKNLCEQIDIFLSRERSPLVAEHQTP